MSTLLRRSVAAAATLALAASLAACGGSDDSTAGDGKKSVLRVGVQKDGIRSILNSSGLLKDLPYEIEWSEFTAGPPIIEAAAADQIDVAWVGGVPPIFGAASGAAFKIVAAVHEEDKQNDSILLPAGSKITKLEELKGKKIAVGKGTSANGLLLNSLASVGLSIDDVEPQYLAPADGLAAFRAGQVDAWVIWDPFIAQAQVQDKAIDLTELTNSADQDAWLQFEIASSKALEKETSRANIADFVDLVGEAFAWAKENPAEWAKGWSEESGIPLDVLSTVTARKASTVVPVGPEDIAITQALADRFTEVGQIPKKVDVASIVDNLVE